MTRQGLETFPYKRDFQRQYFRYFLTVEKALKAVRSHSVPPGDARVATQRGSLTEAKCITAMTAFYKHRLLDSLETDEKSPLWDATDFYRGILLQCLHKAGKKKKRGPQYNGK